MALSGPVQYGGAGEFEVVRQLEFSQRSRTVAVVYACPSQLAIGDITVAGADKPLPYGLWCMLQQRQPMAATCNSDRSRGSR